MNKETIDTILFVIVYTITLSIFISIFYKISNKLDAPKDGCFMTTSHDQKIEPFRNNGQRIGDARVVFMVCPTGYWDNKNLLN